jgi:rRNA processing protein Gar1
VWLICLLLNGEIRQINGTFKYFNQVGKIDEIFGTLRDFFVSVKLSDEVKAHSFKKGQQLFIDPAKMLPLARFLPGGDGQYFFFALLVSIILYISGLSIA